MKNTLISSDKHLLINELTLGRDLIKQLKVHLGQSSLTVECLITKILSSFDKAILMVNCDKPEEGLPPQQIKGSTSIKMSTMSPHSVIDGNPGIHYSPDDIIRVSSKRRRKLPRWTDKVHIGLETGLEGSPDDGYDWRKYGQKDILGAKYPRSYYRCCNRDAQECKAIKQVQRSNEDPSILSITYEGRHTCIQISDLTVDEQQTANDQYSQDHHHQDRKGRQNRKRSNEVVLNFQRVESSSEVVKMIKESDTQELVTTSSSFSLSPSTSTIVPIKKENSIFSSSTLFDNNLNIMTGCCFSPPYNMSAPAIDQSGSNFLDASYSPILDLIFSLDPVDFQAHFLLDTPRIF